MWLSGISMKKMGRAGLAHPVQVVPPARVGERADDGGDARVAEVVDGHRAAVVQREAGGVAVDLVEVALVVGSGGDDMHERVQHLDGALLQHEAPLRGGERRQQ